MSESAAYAQTYMQGKNVCICVKTRCLDTLSCVYMHVHAYACVYMRVKTVLTHFCVFVCVPLCLHICDRVWCVCPHTSTIFGYVVWTCMYVCMYVYACVFLCTLIILRIDYRVIR